MGVLSLGLLLGAATGCTSDQEKAAGKTKASSEKQKQHLVPLLMVIQIQVKKTVMMLLLLVQVVRDDRCITSQRSWHESSYFRKMPVAGGNTIKSSSGMNASQTKFQEKKALKIATINSLKKH